VPSRAPSTRPPCRTLLHLHARDNETGAPSVNPDDFRPFLSRIKQASDAVVNISTGGSLTLSIADRIKPAATFSAEMCSMNMGSMNFSFHPLAKRYETWKFDWEKDYVANSDGNIFRNTFADNQMVISSATPLPTFAKPPKPSRPMTSSSSMNATMSGTSIT